MTDTETHASRIRCANRAECYQFALDLLREARDLLAGAPKAQDKVRAAITSCEGAIRNARSQAYRVDSGPMGYVSGDNGRQDFYVIQARDVGRRKLYCFGRSWLVANHWGVTMPDDVGRRVIKVHDAVLQIENDEQFAARREAERST